MKRMLYLSLYTIVLALLFQPAAAQRTVRANIEQMVSSAGMIVHGTVTNVESRVDPQTHMLATFVTIAVSENFYGAGQPAITLKMVGGTTKKSTLKFADMPHFTVGEEVFSLFHTPSAYGFTSPVGMGQGKFTVRTEDGTDRKLVRNSANNTRLFSGMKNRSVVPSAVLSAEGKEIEASAFASTIRSLVTILKK